MKRLIFLSGILIILLSLIKADNISTTGYVRSYMGLLLNDNNDYSIIQNTLNLNFEQIKDKVALKANPYIYQYPHNNLKLRLRELYMDLYFNSIDLRIGKQQIIWGKADGVFITDIVSPKDLTEFLLPDFEEIRMGITSVKADYYIGNNTLELVWIPAFQGTVMPDSNSIWFPKMDLAGNIIYDFSDMKVNESFKNSEFFTKFSALTSAIDFELMFAYAYDDDPTIHIHPILNSQTHKLSGVLLKPKYNRLHVYGGSFSTTLGPMVLRGEGALYTGKYFNLSELSPSTDNIIKKDYLHYLLGIDYTTFYNIKLSAQFIQQYILDYEDIIKNDEFENMGTFLATKDFLNETLFTELFIYYGFNNNDALIRPKVTYDFADGFEILIGANIFTGTKGRFGQFNNNDMVYSKIKYSF